jgi:hypothetical protein
MNSILFEITPKFRDKNKHRGLGIVSAVFAFLLVIFIIWAGMSRQISGWTIFILVFPVLLFSAVAWFVLRFGGDYVLGIRVYPYGIGTYFPLKNDPLRQEQIIRFEEIQRLDFEETLEVHRAGRRIKSINVYRIRVHRFGQEKPELLAEMLDLLPDQIIQFRCLPEFIANNNLLAPDQINKSLMPVATS